MFKDGKYRYSLGFGGNTELGGIDLFDDAGINRFEFHQSAVNGHGFGSHGKNLLKIVFAKTCNIAPVKMWDDDAPR